jgi:hypothetical protein
MEDALERGDAGVLLSKDAEDARTGLSNGERTLTPFFMIGNGFLTI